MEFATKQYFKEQADNRVKGFTIIETGSGQVRIAEKWNRPDGSNKWLTYWVENHDLNERLDDDLCEHAGSLTSEQFTAVCEKSDSRVEA